MPRAVLTSSTCAEVFGGPVEKFDVLEGTGNQGKNWMYTIFGQGDDHATRLFETKKAFDKLKEIWPPMAVVLAMQVELCSTSGKPHVQGVVKFKDNQRRSKLFASAGLRFWCERPRHFEEAVQYCTKDDTFIGEEEYRFQIGEVAKSKQGARTDIEAMVTTIKAMCVVENPETRELYTDDDIIKHVISAHPDVYMKYGQRVEQIIRLSRDKIMHPPPPKWHVWQNDLLAYVEGNPDDREILFVKDEAGGAGKSTMTRYLMGTGKAMSLTGTVANMSHIISQNQHIRVWIFDVTRAVAEFSKHLLSQAEMLKNGICINTKYHTTSTILRKCHVIFFVNDLPAGVRNPDAEGKILLSQDRVTVWNVYKDGYDVLCHRGDAVVKGFKPATLLTGKRAFGAMENPFSPVTTKGVAWDLGKLKPGDDIDEVRCFYCGKFIKSGPGAGGGAGAGEYCACFPKKHV